MPCVVDGWQPGIFGRGCRIVTGFAMLLIIENVWNMESDIDSYYVAMVVLNVYLLTYSINLMFNKASWGYYPQFVFLLLWLAGFVYDDFNLNGYLSKLLCNLCILWSFGLIGIAYILCGILGIGGCELMAYYAIFNHFKSGDCSCEEIDCQIPISPLYVFDKIEMIFLS